MARAPGYEPKEARINQLEADKAELMARVATLEAELAAIREPWRPPSTDPLPCRDGKRIKALVEAKLIYRKGEASALMCSGWVIDGDSRIVMWQPLKPPRRKEVIDA